ncbi:hypothetical protein Tco_0468797 [Tanacetum coccineum]
MTGKRRDLSFPRTTFSIDSGIHPILMSSLSPEFLPTKSQVKINLYVLTQLFTEFDKTCKKRITPTGVTEREIEAPDCILILKIKNQEHQIQKKDNVNRELESSVTNVYDKKLHQIEVKFESCLLEDLSKQEVLAPESVETVREIVEEARVVKPLDNVLNYACQYTKLSQELVEYVIGTCPKEFTERDSKAPSIPLTRKKQVTFTDTCNTSTNNTQKHGVHQKTQPSNVQVIPSTGVSSSTRASGSKPKSNTKHNRILPAKSVNNKKVEDHPRTNKSVWTKVNRVDSSISSKHVVINSNSESVCKTCNKCLNSANIKKICVVNILSSVNATPTVKIVLNKGKQIWKPKGKLSDNSLNKTKQIWQPKGKLSDNSLNKTKQVWKATGKLFANVGYQWRPTGKKFTSGKLNCGYQWRPTGKKFALGELCPLTRLPVTCTTVSANQQDPNTNWGSEIPNPPNLTVFKCRWAFTTSANVPSIYILLFWNTLTHDAKTERWIIASQDETTGPSVHPEDATSTKMVRETLSHADAESGGNSEKINSETDTEILNVGSNSEQSHVALAGPNPEHMHDVFLATNYPKVHESLKHTTKEHVHLENPPSSSRTLSSMKNLEDS